MKIGDLVEDESGDLGIVVLFDRFLIPERWEGTQLWDSWKSELGRRVTVMWQGGNITTVVPESSLKVVTSKD